METQELVKKEQQKMEVTTPNAGIFSNSMVSLDSPDFIPDIDSEETVQIELAQNYWTPDQIGESKAGVFMGVKLQTRIDPDTGEEEDPLPTANFLTKENGTVTSFTNASKILLGIMQDVPEGAAVRITYMGKKKNKNNSYSSDNWSVKPLNLSR